MSTLDTKWPTLLDVARRLDPGGKIATVVEVLNESNEILDDIPFTEGNLPTGHKSTVRASLPTPTWRLLNKGVQPTKSQGNQITDTCGMLEAYSEVDKSLAQLNGNTAAWRLSEDKAHLEGMNQAFATTLIYGDTSVDEEKFVGLAPRYYSITSTVTTSVNVIDAGGSGTDNTSIWLVGWSQETVHGIFPKGSKAGLQMNDLGEQTLLDSDSGRYQGYRTHYKWDCGLTVRDWRYVVRVANIDVSALRTAGDADDSSCNLIKYLSLALDVPPVNGSVRWVLYCNNTVRSYLRIKMLSKSNVWITLDQLQSPTGVKRPTLSFMGVPIRRVDKILNTETALT